MRTILFSTLSMALLLLPGCGGGDTSRPDDLPKLYPVSITITQEDKPLEGATVTLDSKTPSKYAASGTTDASGTAVLRTYGYDGAPTGDYAVLVKKVGSENQKESKDAEGQTYLTGGQSYSYVDAKYSDKSGTAFSISVADKAVKETFDVGKAVRILLGNNAVE